MSKPWLVVLSVALFNAAAEADVPDPSESNVTVTPPSVGSQYRFNFLGTLDVMTVTVDVHESNGDPCVSLPVNVILTASGLPGFVWDCCPWLQADTDNAGQVQFSYSKLGGGGTLHIQAIAGSTPLNPVSVAFTTPDPDGTGPPLALPDLADFMAALTQYVNGGGAMQWADYNEDNAINVVDLPSVPM